MRTGLLPGRYAEVELLARGGMGEIYRATDTALGRVVAVKVLADRWAEDGDVRGRFTREALAAARLSGSPSIVTIYDVGEWRGRPFIVMECLGGGSLEEALRAGRPPPGRALDWLEQAGAALDAAHREGIVHRDVKPANLLLDAHGRVHVADFGIASAAGLDSLTLTGTVLGTASYISPEQAQGERATSASDRYALGVVAFELLSGRRPFEADTVAAEAAAHVSGRVPSVREVDPALPAQLDAVFLRALAKDPAQRFGSAAELVAALRAAFEGAAGPTRVLAPPRAVRRRRSPLLPLLGLVALLALGAGLAAALLTGRGHGTAGASVRTVTQSGTTVRQTVTAPASTTPPSSQSGDALNAQGYDLIKRGDYAGALPLLQQAVQKLQGQPSDPSDGYANYNLGQTLVNLHRCADALPYLEAAKHLEPGRHEVQDAIKFAKHCS